MDVNANSPREVVVASNAPGTRREGFWTGTAGASGFSAHHMAMTETDVVQITNIIKYTVCAMAVLRWSWAGAQPMDPT